ncbi:mechanosensitive ion channel domain-containing protein [Bacteroidota bacterium]
MEYLLLYKPFKINDKVEVQGNTGKVAEITLHDTILKMKIRIE